jgi:hypothetical protein
LELEPYGDFEIKGKEMKINEWNVILKFDFEDTVVNLISTGEIEITTCGIEIKSNEIVTMLCLWF